MDPITAALAAGAVAGLTDAAAQVVKDAYARLRAALRARYPEAAGHVQALEADPASETGKASLAETLEAAGASADAELLELAHALVEAVEREAPEAAASAGVDLERVRARFLDVRRVGGRVRVRDAEMTDGGITIQDVQVGGPDPNR